MKKVHYLVGFIEYGSEHESFTLNDAYDHLDLNEDQRKVIDQEIRGSDLIAHDGSYHSQRDKPVSLSINAIFRNIEHLELKEARRSSKNATLLAIFAIIISIYIT